MSARQSQALTIGGTSPNSGPKARALTLWKRRTCRPSDRHALTYARKYSAQRAEDLGGIESLSVAQRALIDSEALLLAMVRLILAAPDHKLLTKDKEGNTTLSPAAREVSKLLTSAARISETLGVQRRPRRAETLSELMAQRVAGEVGPDEPIPVEAVLVS